MDCAVGISAIYQERYHHIFRMWNHENSPLLIDIRYCEIKIQLRKTRSIH